MKQHGLNPRWLYRQGLAEIRNILVALTNVFMTFPTSSIPPGTADGRE